MGSFKEIDELLIECGSLPDGAQKVSLAIQAVTLADQTNDLNYCFETRLTLIDSATFSGRSDLAITAFAWCLAQSDADPDRFDLWSLLWRYKWILGNIDQFPGVQLEKIYELLADFRKRLESFDVSLKPYYNSLRGIETSSGNLALAKKAFDDWQKEASDSMSDCKACEINSMVTFNVYLENYKEAFRLAEPLLTKKYQCSTVPNTTLAILLLPSLYLGKLEEAKSFHSRGYASISNSPNYIVSWANHIKYLTIIGNLKRARKLFDKHFSIVFKSPIPNEQFTFYSVAHLLFTTIGKSTKRKIKVHLPFKMTIYQEDSMYEPEVISKWFQVETQKIADQFDERNKNEFYKEKAAKTLGLVDFFGLI